MDRDSLLTARQLRVTFDAGSDPVYAVRGVDLTLRRGERLGIAGESGSGKSVTCRALLGLLPDNASLEGTVRLDSIDMIDVPEPRRRRLRGGRVGYIFQDARSALDPYVSVGRQLESTAAVHGVPGPERRTLALSWLSRVGIPDPAQRFHAYPHELSGGMCQRVGIALALLPGPPTLIADEPTSDLDVSTQMRLIALLERMCREEELSLILVSHNLGVVRRLCDRVAVMYRGEVVEEGATEQVLRNPKAAYTRDLLAAVPWVTKAAGTAGGADRTERTDAATPVLTVDRLSVRYPVLRGAVLPRVVDWIHALKEVSFTLSRGEILGVVGESGSGKSTLLRTILLLEEVAAGSLLFHGHPLLSATEPERQRYRNAVQVVFQNPRSSLDPALRNSRVAAEPLTASAGRTLPAATERSALERIRAALQEVELSLDVARRFPDQLSGGQQQRLAIARGTETHPEILFADESVSALDVRVQARVLELLRRLRNELGFALIFVTHDLGVVRRLCDTVLVLREGRAVEYADAERFFAGPQHPYSRELLDAARATELGVAPEEAE